MLSNASHTLLQYIIRSEATNLHIWAPKGVKIADMGPKVYTIH